MKCNCRKLDCPKCKEILWTNFMDGAYLPRWMIDTYNAIRENGKKPIHIYSMVPLYIATQTPEEKAEQIRQDARKMYKLASRSTMLERYKRLPPELQARIKYVSAESAEKDLKGISGIKANLIAMDEASDMGEDIYQRVARSMISEFNEKKRNKKREERGISNVVRV